MADKGIEEAIYAVTASSAWRRGYVNRRFEAAREALLAHGCDCEDDDCLSDAVRAVFAAVGLEAPAVREPGGSR